MIFDCNYTDNLIILTVRPERSGILGRFFDSRRHNVEQLSVSYRLLAFALADIRALADEHEETLKIESEKITLSHRLAAMLTTETATQLGLPPLTDLVLRTDAEGVLGSTNFMLRYQWMRNGQQRSPKRIGCILETDKGPQRIPLWLMEAIEVAENFKQSTNDATHWEALARFRNALELDAIESDYNYKARVSMTDFLAGLEVSLSDSFSISPHSDGDDFEVIPFLSEHLDKFDSASESMSELNESELKTFQQTLRRRGSLNAFNLGPKRYLVIDRSASPVLKTMAKMQSASIEERREFIKNPSTKITQAVEEHLLREDNFAELEPLAQEEAVENATNKVFVETEEYIRYSERVTGKDLYRGNPVADIDPSGTTWLPEIFSTQTLQEIDQLSSEELQQAYDAVQTGIEEGVSSINFENITLPANEQTLQFLKARLANTTNPNVEDTPTPDNTLKEQSKSSGPIILTTADNFTEVAWLPNRKLRTSELEPAIPSSITTSLKDHQIKSFTWQVDAWKAGLPGILNADEQGLGKTLQTIAFLVWLNEHMKRQKTVQRGPILVVAPTSLLQNWEKEVKDHVEMPGLGQLIPLYGSTIKQRRIKDKKTGQDVDDGEAHLDFSELEKQINNGKGHLNWVLTTYKTLTNYQHSLAKIPFVAAVFDEIQNIKNPGTLAANASRAMNADFRIGLTGTPIENTTVDLWAIMDQLTPGALGSLEDFRQRYGEANEQNMQELHSRVFESHDELPPLALRRLKENVARDLPSKTRFLHPRKMSELQASRYEEARAKFSAGSLGDALKRLHHIRSVSVHPAFEKKLSDDEFISSSAKLSATFEILRKIQKANERALVFIESIQMQYRFIELVKIEFNLKQVDLINGQTPISKRQEIVNRFQEHLEKDQGFDLLVLGPKAAGTGLTLTAATHVIHLSRWWNPAVEEQCNDRTHRLGQARPVTVHVPLAVHPLYREHSFDFLLQSLMQRKRRLASAALWPMGDTKEDTQKLQESISSNVSTKELQGDIIEESMKVLFERDELTWKEANAFGAWEYP
ncbi:MAG: DEAD/DEAH box helicase [Alcaligenaceae bacterium]|nr:DEAD/DEAH box helicase [Alcaligenaceae bacterium]